LTPPPESGLAESSEAIGAESFVAAIPLGTTIAS